MSKLYRYCDSYVTRRGSEYVVYAVAVYDKSLWTVLTLKDPQLGYRQITILPEDLPAVIEMLQAAREAIGDPTSRTSPASSEDADPTDVKD